MANFECNICDLQCPVKALVGVDARVNTNVVDASGEVSVGKLLGGLFSGNAWGIIKRGVEGAQQAIYAANQCPSRAEDPETWTPSERCIQKAEELAAGLQPFTAELTAWEAKTVGRIGLGPDLRPVEPPQPEA